MQPLPYPSPAATACLKRIAGRRLDHAEDLATEVRAILEAVRRDGDSALMQYINRFDAPALTLDQLQVSEAEIAAAGNQVDAAFRATLQRAIEQITAFHQRQLPNSWFDTPRPGVFLGQLIRPVDAAGIYVPGGQGGQTPLVSSVLMGAVPARIAGVPKLVMCTPPTPDGHINPCLLVAAAEVGITQIFRAGSAWGIAALAFGTQQVPQVDVIVGPGNIYVTLAKKLLAGTVGIDLIAGPSEILIVADDSARADFIAADLLSQAEHDALASAVLITTSPRLAEGVAAALERQMAQLPRRDIARQALDGYGALLVVSDLAAAFELVNQLAPEHLELHIADPLNALHQIRHAGAIFMGPYTPEPVGDYLAGPNHVLPTAGSARFSSALAVDHFLKKTSLLQYSQTAFEREAPDILRLAAIEGLDAHAAAVQIRLPS